MSDDIESLVRGALAQSSVREFDAGFADRAWNRFSNSRGAPDVVSLAERMAKRLIPFAMAASLLLAMYSVHSHATSTSQPFVERVLGWQPVSDRSVYDGYDLSVPAGDR